MVLNKQKTKATTGWSAKFSLKNANTSHQLPILVEKPKINYSAVKHLCAVKGLGDRFKDSTLEGHNAFMETYSKIFTSFDDRLPRLTLKQHVEGNRKHEVVHNGAHSQKIPHDHRPAHYCSNHSVSLNHNIADHLALLHKQHITPTREGMLNARSHALRRLLRKLPFERTRNDQEQIYHHLHSYAELTARIPLKILRELCSVVQLEKWNDAGYTVFSGSYLYLILRGSVMQCDERYLASLRKSSSDCSVLDGERDKNLVAGQCFGTLRAPEADGEDHIESGRTSSFITLGPCEFVKISARDFLKMKQFVENRTTNENLELMQSCRLFKNCSKVTLGEIVSLIRWKSFRPGAVLVNEGESCRVIGFISKGTCLLKRSIDVSKTNKDGTQERRQKQVTVGRLGPGDSFGECTVLRNQEIAYTVVTASAVSLGIILQHDFAGVDEVTKTLLLQCYEAIESNVKDVDIQKQYIEQQKQHEWRNFKKNVIREVMIYRSILPGYGKWSRNPTMADVVNLVP